MNNLTEMFINLVTIDSPTGTEDACADFLYTYLQDKVDVLKKDAYGNLYARINGNEPAIFFSAHLDTVEPGRGIKPLIKDGYVYSDGTTILGADNKSTIACYLELIEKLKSKSHKTIEFIFTKEEETTSGGASNFEYSLLQAKHGYCFDSVNPVGTIITGSPFYESFDLTLTGKAAHASKPHEAVNALLIFNTILNSISLGKIDDTTVANIGLTTIGSARNTVPGEAVIHGEIRGFVLKEIETYKTQLIDAVETACTKYSATHSITFIQENLGYTFEESESFIHHIKNSMQQTGISPLPLRAWAVSDANIFNHRGLRCVNLGDGVEFPHSKEERIKVADMEKLLELMVELAI